VAAPAARPLDTAARAAAASALQRPARQHRGKGGMSMRAPFYAFSPARLKCKRPSACSWVNYVEVVDGKGRGGGRRRRPGQGAPGTLRCLFQHSGA
jgi:hypothetical protein